jgi:tRNA A37 N6-isopentenylltransferase MiaA
MEVMVEFDNVIAEIDDKLKSELEDEVAWLRRRSAQYDRGIYDGVDFYQQKNCVERILRREESILSALVELRKERNKEKGLKGLINDA